MDACRFADTWHSGDDDVGHVAFSGDDLEELYRFCVADNIVEEYGSVLFDPASRPVSKILEASSIG